MRSAIYSGSIDDLLPVATEYKESCRCPEFGFVIELDRHMRELKRFMDGADSDLIVLLDDAGEPCGYMGITIIRSPFGVERVANERYWYVRPRCRGVASMRMLALARKWAREHGCTHFICTASAMASDLHDRTCALYEDIGMSKFETSYIEKISEV